MEAKRNDPPTNTFPQIFINNKRIGGYNELQTFFSFNGDDDF
jgi:glutaredoxin